MSDQQHIGQPAPMTAERLADIRTLLAEAEQARNHLTDLAGWPSDRPRAPVLQAAIDLLAFAEAALPVLRAVAEMDIVHSAHVCPGCKRPIRYTSDPSQDAIDHTLECPFIQTRRVLAELATAEGSEQG